MRVSVNGMIASDEDAGIVRFFGLDKVFRMVCPQDIRDAIANTPPGDTLTLEINSGGGSLYAGFEMYSLLVAAEVPTRAEVQCLLMTAIDGYLEQLYNDDLIAEGWTVEINLEKTRAYLKSIGVDVSAMTDDEIRRADTGDKVFIKISVTILDAIEEIDIEANI